MKPCIRNEKSRPYIKEIKSTNCLKGGQPTSKHPCEELVSIPRPKNYWTSLVYLNYIKRSQNKGSDKRKKNLFLSRRGSGWLGGGIVFNINVLRAGLEKRAGSSVQIKFDRAEVHLREVFNSVHPEIFKTRCIVVVQ